MEDRILRDLEAEEEKKRKYFLNMPPVQQNTPYAIAPIANFKSAQQQATPQTAGNSFPQFKSNMTNSLPQPQQPQQDVLKQGSQNVLQNAQQQAMQGFNSQTQGLVSQQTNKLLQDPNQGMDFTKYRQGLEDQIRREQSQAFDALRAKTGMTSNTAKTMQDLLGFQLGNVQERNKTLNEFDLNANAQQRDNILNAIDQGRKTLQSEQDVYNTNLKGKLDTAGTGLGYAQLDQQKELVQKEQEFAEKMKMFDADTQKSLVELQGKVDKGLLITKQEFDSSQNLLANQLQKYIAEGNWSNASKIQQMQIEAQANAQKAEQTWATAERQATQSWSTGERMGKEDFDRATQYLDIKMKEAMQSKDIDAQKYISEKQRELQLTMQMQGFDHDKQMFTLDTEAKKAFQAKDFENTIYLKEKEYEKQFQMLDKQLTHDESMVKLKDTMQKDYMNMQQMFDKEKMAIQQSNDINKAEKLAQLEMQQKKFELDWQEKMTNKQMEMQQQQFNKNYLLEEAKVALSKAGLEQDKIMQQYSALMASGKTEEANQLLANSIKTSDPELAKKIMNPDPLAWKKNLDMENKIQQYQWAQTHPELAQFDSAGNFIGLTENGKKLYNSWLNESFFGEPKNAYQVKINAIKNGDLGVSELKDPNSDIYKSALMDSSITTIKPEVTNFGSKFTLNNMPPNGGLIKYNGKIYQKLSMEDDGSQYGYIYSFLDPTTGSIIKINTGVPTTKMFEPFNVKPVENKQGTGNPGGSGKGQEVGLDTDKNTGGNSKGNDSTYPEKDMV